MLRQVARREAHVLANVWIQVRLDFPFGQVAQLAEQGERVRQFALAQLKTGLSHRRVREKYAKAHEHGGQLQRGLTRRLASGSGLAKGRDQESREGGGGSGYQRNGVQRSALGR